jgi:hypothetical protein
LVTLTENQLVEYVNDGGTRLMIIVKRADYCVHDTVQRKAVAVPRFPERVEHEGRRRRRKMNGIVKG